MIEKSKIAVNEIYWIVSFDIVSVRTIHSESDFICSDTENCSVECLKRRQWIKFMTINFRADDARQREVCSGGACSLLELFDRIETKNWIQRNKNWWTETYSKSGEWESGKDNYCESVIACFLHFSMHVQTTSYDSLRKINSNEVDVNTMDISILSYRDDCEWRLLSLAK